MPTSGGKIDSGPSYTVSLKKILLGKHQLLSTGYLHKLRALEHVAFYTSIFKKSL